MPGRNAQVSRIYTILNILEGAPQGLTVAEIGQRVGDRGHEAVKRTIYRDLEALNAAGFPLFPKDGNADHAATKWVLERITTINKHLVLSTRELFALYLARGMLTPLKDTPFYEDLETVFNKIEEKLGSKGKEHLSELSNEIQFQPGPRWGLGLDPDVLETVRACCAERQVLEACYQSASSGKKGLRRLGPHFLYFAQGSLYLVAEDFSDSSVKVFSCPRMSEARMVNEVYEKPLINPEEYFKDSFGIYKGENPILITIEFAPIVAPHVRERRWHTSQRIVSKGDGSIVFSVEVAITPELVQWVLGFGSDAFVIEPQDLQHKIVEEAEKTRLLYHARAA